MSDEYWALKLLDFAGIAKELADQKRLASPDQLAVLNSLLQSADRLILKSLGRLGEMKKIKTAESTALAWKMLQSKLPHDERKVLLERMAKACREDDPAAFEAVLHEFEAMISDEKNPL